jgi:hypothetical protein
VSVPSRVGVQAQAGSDATSSLALLADVNTKAKKLKKAKEKKDKLEVPVDELTDAVARAFGYGPERYEGSYSPVNSMIRAEADRVKDRLKRSEIAYQQGKKEGVREENVVRAMNNLAGKFGAPGYAKTEKYEVRKLRVSMLSFEFDLVSKQVSKKSSKERGDGKKIVESIGPTMSPLEAVYVTSSLIVQKLTNPEYQLTHEERRAQWAEEHDGRRAFETDAGPRILPQTGRQVEMSHIVSRGVRARGPSEQRDLIHESLDILGIDR